MSFLSKSCYQYISGNDIDKTTIISYIPCSGGSIVSLNLSPKTSTTPFQASKIIKGNAIPLFDYFSKDQLQGKSETDRPPTVGPSDFTMTLQYETCSLSNGKSSFYFPNAVSLTGKSKSETLTSGKIILSPPPPGSVTKGECPPYSSGTAQVFLVDANPKNKYSLQLVPGKNVPKNGSNVFSLQNFTSQQEFSISFPQGSIKLPPLETTTLNPQTGSSSSFSKVSIVPLFTSLVQNKVSSISNPKIKKLFVSNLESLLKKQQIKENFPGEGDEKTPISTSGAAGVDAGAASATPMTEQEVIDGLIDFFGEDLAGAHTGIVQGDIAQVESVLGAAGGGGGGGGGADVVDVNELRALNRQLYKTPIYTEFRTFLQKPENANKNFLTLLQEYSPVGIDPDELTAFQQLFSQRYKLYLENPVMQRLMKLGGAKKTQLQDDAMEVVDSLEGGAAASDEGDSDELIAFLANTIFGE